MTRLARTILLFALVAASIPPASAQSETGWASWYTGGFHGERTASGEAYDHDALTAAHPSLPLGSKARVIRTDTGRSVTVRINDRMTAEPNHVIDVSGAAARRLGLLESGIALVRVDPVNTIPIATAPVSDGSSYQGITLQLGVFANREAAAQLASQFVDTWIQSVPTDSGTMYRVYYREFDAEAAARAEQERLRSQGQDSFLRHVSAQF